MARDQEIFYLLVNTSPIQYSMLQPLCYEILVLKNHFDLLTCFLGFVLRCTGTLHISSGFSLHFLFEQANLEALISSCRSEGENKLQ